MKVMFYLKRGRFDSEAFVVGHTLAVFYAHLHDFLDLNTGLRVEEMSTVKVCWASGAVNVR